LFGHQLITLLVSTSRGLVGYGHLTIVFAALAVSHYVEHQTGWRIKKFVRTTRRYRTVKIKAGRQTLTAADPLPDDLHDALAKIGSTGVH
jgi:hypothetical protein